MPAHGDRRTALRWAMAAALAPVWAGRAGAAVVGGNKPFAPPAGSMIFTRRLERGLSGNNRLVVERSFAVGFTAMPDGWTVTGEQVAASVEAPEKIASLAALERQRIETGLFPLALDRTGLIVGGPDPRPAKELDQAVAIVRRELDKRGVGHDERQERDAFVKAVHDAGAKMTSLLPGDLFAPRDDPPRVERELALPGGGAGTIEVCFTAQADPATGLMRKARREIVTAIAADRRFIREDWTLAFA